MTELKRMPIDEIDSIVKSVDFSKSDIERIWPVKRVAFETW